MTKAYCFLGAAALLFNGTTLAPLVAWYHADPVDQHASRPRNTPAAAFVVQADQGDDGLFRVMSRIDGRAVSFIIDTGATATVLGRRDAATLGLALSPGERTSALRTANGSAQMAWRRIGRLDVGGARIRDLDVVVAENGPEHSLLGQDVLSQLGAITMTGSRLEIRPLRS